MASSSQVGAQPRSRLWVVDDSATARLQLEQLLSQRYDVTVFPDGPSAIEVLGASTPPALIVLDWEMPMMTGPEVCRFIRSSRDEIELPILMVTGNTEIGAAREALAAGANDIMRRPFDAPELLARINNLLHLGTLAAARAASLHALFAQVPAAVAHLREPQHVYDMANAAYRMMFDGAPLIGRTFRQMLSARADASIVDALDRAYASGEAFSTTDVLVPVTVGVNRAMAELYFDFTYQPTRDARGAVDGIFVHAVDVTESVHAKQRARYDAEQLARSQHWLSTLLTSIGDAVIATDREQKIVFANPVSAALTGWSAIEMQGRLLDDVFHVVREPSRQAVLVRRDGARIAIDDSVAPTRDPDGTVTGAILVFRDVRERAQVEHERRQRTRQLELAVTVSAALASPEPLADQLQRCAAALVSHLDVAAARIWTLPAGSDVLQLCASAGLDGPRAWKLDGVVAARTAYVTDEVARDLEVRDPALQAFAAFPIVTDGQVAGVLAVFARAALSEDELQALSGVTNQVAIGIERAHVSAERERLHELNALARRDAELQREQLASLFRQAPVAIAVLRGRDHVVELANPHVCALWGRAESQILGKPLFDALPELRGQGVEALLDGVLTTAIAYAGTELPVRLARGPGGAIEVVYFNFVYEPLRDADGVVDAVLVVATDVTPAVLARREAARLGERVRENEERLRLALEASEAGAWELDLATSIVQGDRIVRDLFKLRPDEDFSLALAFTKIHPDDAPHVEASIARALQGELGGAYHEQYRVLAGGQESWILARGQALFDPSGAARRFLGTLLDITVRKQAESLREALLEAERKSREAAEEQRDFEQYIIGIVSHDLRSPLQAIEMGAELLSEDARLSEPSQRILVRIRNNTDRAGRLIRDVLDFTQARLGGGFALHFGLSNLATIAGEIVDELRVTAPKRDIVLKTQGITSGEWDADRLAQVVSNLTSNALKYGAKSSAITVTVTGVADGVELAVHNLGAVIAPERVPGLFLPMQRSDASGSNPQRSVGLGLYIVDKIVSGHAGTIEVTSSEGDGTTFRVRLPRRPAGTTPSRASS